MQLVAAEVKKPPSGTISVPKSSYDVSHIKPFCMLLYAVEISNIYIYIYIVRQPKSLNF